MGRKEGDVIKMFSSRMAENVNQIRSCGDTIPEKKIVEKVLGSSPATCFQRISLICV